MDKKRYDDFLKQGVNVLDYENVYVEPSVTVGSGTTLEPFCVLLGLTTVGCNCTVGSFSYLKNAKILDGAEIRSSRITDSTVGQNTTVGPNAHLRQNSVVGDNCRVGNFVELKSSVLGQGSKASHLTYIGDAEVGKDCNVGCGVVFVNYDGKTKHRTEVGDNVFIGCNCNLVAPVRIASDCFIACGTTVTKDTVKDDFVIGRTRETVKPNTANKYLVKK